jgi:hypothetical protein
MLYIQRGKYRWYLLNNFALREKLEGCADEAQARVTGGNDS